MILFLAWMGFSTQTQAQGPKFTLTSSTASAEKGHTFEIYLAIETDIPLESLTVSPSAPGNFSIRPVPSPGIATLRVAGDKSVAIGRMPAGSGLTLTFLVIPP